MKEPQRYAKETKKNTKSWELHNPTQRRIDSKISSLLIAVARDFGSFLSAGPAGEGECRGVDHDDESEDAEHDVADFAEAGFGYPAVMEHWL